MNIFFHISNELEGLIKAAAAGLSEFDERFYPDLRIAEPKFGDFQANGVLPFAKLVKKNPRELASVLVQALKEKDFGNFISIDIAGPGFINFKLSPQFLFAWLQNYRDETCYKAASSSLYQGKTIVVDYSSPNTAKQMHIGHIRSMIIGEAIRRIFCFCGANVIRDNHIGDWGTQFGIIIMAIKRLHFDLDNCQNDPLSALEHIYKEGAKLSKEDPTALEEARKELVKLQQGDSKNLGLWN